MFFRVFLWSESATTLRQDWTNTCVLEPCKNDASEREERKSPNPGKRNAKRSVRVYAANCDCVTCLSKNQRKGHKRKKRQRKQKTLSAFSLLTSQDFWVFLSCLSEHSGFLHSNICAENTAIAGKLKNNQEWPRQTKPKKGQFMNFSQGHSGTKVQCESCLFS